LFKVKPPARKAYAPEGKAKILTRPAQDAKRQRHPYIEPKLCVNNEIDFYCNMLKHSDSI